MDKYVVLRQLSSSLLIGLMGSIFYFLLIKGENKNVFIKTKNRNKSQRYIQQRFRGSDQVFDILHNRQVGTEAE